MADGTRPGRARSPESRACRRPALGAGRRSHLSRPGKSDGRHVDGLGALVAGLGVVRHLGALGEGLEAAPGDALVMDEQVLAGFIRRDDPEALLVAEPLDGSGRHRFVPPVQAKRGGAMSNNCGTLALLERWARCP